MGGHRDNVDFDPLLEPSGSGSRVGGRSFLARHKTLPSIPRGPARRTESKLKSPGVKGVRLDSLSPATVIGSLQFHRNGAVSIHRLLAGPGNRLDDSGTNFKLGRQLDPAAVICGKQKGSLAKTATVGLPGIQRAPQLQFLVGTLELQPQHSWNARHAAVGKADNQLRSAVSLALPDPGRAQPIAHAGP